MGTTEQELHSLTLVLSSARSGSTLLCRDLASLGGLGFPREYLKGLDGVARRSGVSEADVLERLARGVRDDAPGVAAAKLMVPQAPVTYEALSGRRLPVVEAMSGVVSWARGRFERVLLVVLVRNSIDQAISRAVAEATGIFHSSDQAFRESGGTPPDLGDLNPQILVELGGVIRNRKTLHAVHAEHADIGLLLTYEELTGPVEETTARMVAHARGQGFDVHGETARRRLTKVISDERSATLRDSFLDYLRTEPGT